MKNQLFIFLTTFIFLNSCGLAKESFTGKTIQYKTTDDVTVTADLYKISKTDAPYILLFHQAAFSRGEYREIAPQLNQMGFNCLAADQRSGITVNGVKNETNKSAKKLGESTKYIDAIQDLIATYLYAKNTLKAKKIIIWGSSYSASLVLHLAGLYPNNIKGVLSFSPGEYFKIKTHSIADEAKKIKCPVFITSAKNEQKDWQNIYDNITSKKTFFIPSKNGNHGSKALWKKHESHQEYWLAVKSFLSHFID